MVGKGGTLRQGECNGCHRVLERLRYRSKHSRDMESLVRRLRDAKGERQVQLIYRHSASSARRPREEHVCAENSFFR